MSAPPTTASGPARTLLQLVADLRTPYAHERSFRFSNGALLVNRFLLTASKRGMGEQAESKILALCRDINMPASFLELTRQNVNQARAIHFGFEENETASLYKVYLEVGKPDAEARTGSQLLHIGLKWDIHEIDRQVLTRYLLYPRLSCKDISRRLAALYRESQDEEALELATGVLEAAVSRLPAEELQYLEVTEADSRRRSFDLNAYDAELRLSDLHSLLLRMCRHQSVPMDRFEALHERIGSCAFGHLAGGVHRNGKGFFTVYYGVEWHGGSSPGHLEPVS